MPLLEAVSKSIQGWTNTSLSYAGRVELIKSVLMGKIFFWTSSFALPQMVISRLSQLITRFLWFGQDKKGAHKVSWEQVCLPKEEGGLGLRCISTLNKACLMRYVWAIASKKDSLWVKWINTRYLARDSIWTLNTPASCSWCLRSILQVVNLTQQCIRYFIGNGSSTLLWLDPWHPNGILDPSINSYNRMAKVSSIRQGSDWATGHTSLHLGQGLGNIDTLQQSEDQVAWTASVSGIYSLKSAYNTIRSPGTAFSLAHLAWFKGAVPRFSFITWLQLRGRLPTLDRLHHWGIVQNVTCCLCSQQLETANHLFFECSFSSTIWSAVLNRCLLSHTPTGWDSEQNWLSETFKGKGIVSNIRRLALTATIYHIWTERNNRIHRTTAKPAKLITTYIITAVKARLTFLHTQLQGSPSDTQVFQLWGISLNGNTPKSIWTRWPKPDPGYTAINTDASIRGTTAGLGCILRDHQGAPIIAAAYATNASDSILLHELQAIYKGLQLALQTECKQVMVQSDSNTVIDIILGRANSPWKCWAILSNISSIKSKFCDITFSFLHREANQVADFLSHLCPSNQHRILQSGSFPPELARLIHRDSTQAPYQRR